MASEIPHSSQCANVSRITLHQRSQTRRSLVLALFVLAYALVLPRLFSTMGLPLERALLQSARLAENKSLALDQEFLLDAVKESVVAWDEEEGEDGTRATVVDGGLEASPSPEVNITLPSNINATTDSERKLPSPYLPEALPLFLFLLVSSATGLYFLMRQWFVWFVVWMEYEPVSLPQQSQSEGDWFVHVVPLPNRGKPMLCPLVHKSKFEFQRQTYVWIKPGGELENGEMLLVEGEEAIGGGDESLAVTSTSTAAMADRIGFFRVLLAKANLSIKEYASQAQTGITSESALLEKKSKFGLNTLAVPQIPFIDLLKTQLLMPLSVFQIFSAMLWAVDEYIQYTLFTLLTIVMMEGTTAFQRHKTMRQLRGLGVQSFAVYCKRMGEWIVVPSEDLVPGDVISLRTPDKQLLSEEQRKRDVTVIIPCDVLVIEGSCVVNEATLTGESIPQMKDGLGLLDKGPGKEDAERALDIDGKDRIHVLFSGTSLVAFTPSSTSSTPPPDGGIVCLVLRTGFGSSQGELMQMIEFSNQAVSADSKETMAALFILLVFALVSASYVFQKGMAKGDRTTHELLLKCIIIVTSVVPRQLPVQMALAVNHALMALFNEGIFCTEPFRVPDAGKVTNALFDKTGTLTADELTPIGVTNDLGGIELVPMKNAGSKATLVLAACHSIVALDSVPGKQPELVGDPIEIAAIRGVIWGFDGVTAFPNDTSALEQVKQTVEEKLLTASQGDGVEKNKAVIAKLEKERIELQQAIAQVQAQFSQYSDVKIGTRFHFDAALQRMSCICTANDQGTSKQFVLCKGSPEAMKKLCINLPTWYDTTYQNLSERGMRVLAMGLKQLPNVNKTVVMPPTRVEAESGLEFCGFVCFEAKIRTDSTQVIQSLKTADIQVAMVTGDAPLTALHVAKFCGFSNSPALLLDAQGSVWRSALKSTSPQVELACEFETEACGLANLSQYLLIVTEEGLENLAKKSNGKVWSGLQNVCVFSRMSPRGKAKVIRSLQKLENKFVLMCGDGGNDVGALKQADVGLALLSGYGSANTKNAGTAESVEASGISPEEALNQGLQIEKKRAQHNQKLKSQELAVKRAELHNMQRVWLEEELSKLPESERGIMANVSIMKTLAARINRELQVESALLDKKYGLVASASGRDGGAESLEQQLENANNSGLPTIRPGDASVAAPFTSRVPSVRSVVHLIRQGRCTLLSSLQQQQIMMLECTISAYTYAQISLEGSRSSERQMMVSSWLIMAASLSFSYATPIEKMSPVKPLRSLFHPAVFVSIVGQAAIHLYSMSQAVKMATETMGPEALAKVVAFNKAVQAGTQELEQDEEDPLKMLTQIWHKPFLPNLMNTTVFLVETAQIMSVLFVNYKGRPFMKGMLENHTLFLSLFVCIGGVAFASWEVLPEFNRALHFYPFPDDEYRVRVITQVMMVVLGTFVWDRMVIAVFAPEIFRAMWQETLKTKVTDVLPVFASVFKVFVGFALLGTGNPIVWAAAYYANRKFNEYKEKQENERLGLVV
ncbi:hypothetical protein BASA81_006888 [Batrachochytrium salamandrivorans]|nr:hypothetical protein BASA81_006888 [Batrachochytrium salamandrivorans]